MKNIRRALKFIPGHRKTLAIGFGVGLFMAVITTTIPLAIQSIIDRLFNAVTSGSTDYSAIVVPLLIWVGLRVLYILFYWAQEVVEDNIFTKGMIDFRGQVAAKLERLSITFFEKHRAGQIASQVNQSPPDFGNWLSMLVTDYVGNVLTAIVALTILTYKFPLVGLIVIVLASLYGWVVFKSMQGNRKFWKTNRAYINDYTGVQVENISFIAHIRALGAEKIRSRMFFDVLGKHEQNLNDLWKYQHRRNLLAGAVELLLFAIPILLFAIRALNGDQQPTDIFILSVYLGRITDITARLPRMWTNTAETNDKLGETLEILENEDSVKDPEKPVELKKLGDLELSGVSFQYESSKEEAIKQLDIHIEEGSTVALVGRSGSGKSTVIKLLLRFYDPQTGSVLAGGVDLRQLAQDDLRSRFGVVMQDVALFNDTVANNIAIAKPHANRKEIEKAAKVAHAHEFITSLPEGYDTLVGERGVKLSGGEKQRVSIARAILRDPEVILLDEATSALDSESEQYVQEGLKKLLKGRTAVIIAHRLSTITHADKIVVMDKGQIVEEGTYQGLKKKKGVFSELLARQQL